MRVKAVSQDELNKIDELIPEEYGISNQQMMENAGYQIADLLRTKFSSESSFH